MFEEEFANWLGFVPPKKKRKTALQEAGDFFSEVAKTAGTVAFVLYAGNWAAEVLSGKKKL